MRNLLQQWRRVPEPPGWGQTGLFVAVAVVAMLVAKWSLPSDEPKTATVKFNGTSFTYPLPDED